MMLKLVGFLRGINVGGHHKVPMADLKIKLKAMGFENIRTLLNSGNVAFETKEKDILKLENQIEGYLSESFGFSIPVILRSQKEMLEIVLQDPFATIPMHKEIRLYVTLLKNPSTVKLEIPYVSNDNSFSIFSIEENTVFSVLDLSSSSTPKGMDDLEKLFGKNITTRSWNTIQKVSNL
jgi:uncharacterized protein (DUF1697 family)